MESSSLIDRIDQHLCHFDKGMRNKESFLGWGSWFYTFPDKDFESKTEALISEISKKYHEVDDWEKIRSIFFKVVPILTSKEVKNAIFETIANNKELQNCLDPVVAEYRQEKETNPLLVNDSTHQLTRRIAKAQFAVKLGCLGESAGTGLSGATFMKFVNGKKLGLFKASNEHQSYWKTFHDGTLSEVLYNQPFYLKTHPKAGIQAEVVAYIFSETLNLGLVPPTTLAKFRVVEGSFQLLVPQIEGHIVEEFINALSKFEKDSFRIEELNKFQMFAIFDFILGNLDRHDGNWFVATEKYEHRYILKRIFAIDHDRCFPERNPSSTLGLKSQYAWREHKIAKKCMTDDTKYFVLDKLTEENIMKCIENSNTQIPDFFTRGMIEGVKERLKVVRILANRSDDVTLEGLGNLRTDRNIQRFLSH